MILLGVTKNVFYFVLMIKPKCVITCVGSSIDLEVLTLNPHWLNICNTLWIKAYASSKEAAKNKKSSMYGSTRIP